MSDGGSSRREWLNTRIPDDRSSRRCQHWFIAPESEPQPASRALAPQVNPPPAVWAPPVKTSPARACRSRPCHCWSRGSPPHWSGAVRSAGCKGAIRCLDHAAISDSRFRSARLTRDASAGLAFVMIKLPSLISMRFPDDPTVSPLATTALRSAMATRWPLPRLPSVEAAAVLPEGTQPRYNHRIGIGKGIAVSDRSIGIKDSTAAWK